MAMTFAWRMLERGPRTELNVSRSSVMHLQGGGGGREATKEHVY